MYKKLNEWLAEGDFSGFSKKLTEIRALLRPKNASQLSARLFSPNLFILCDLYRIFPERDFGAKKSVWRGRKGILGVLRAWWRMRKGILGHENRHSRSGEMGNLHFLSGSEKLESFAGCHRKPADEFFGVARMQDERLVKFSGDRIWIIIGSCSFLLGGDLFFFWGCALFFEGCAMEVLGRMMNGGGWWMGGRWASDFSLTGKLANRRLEIFYP